MDLNTDLYSWVMCQIRIFAESLFWSLRALLKILGDSGCEDPPIGLIVSFVSRYLIALMKIEESPSSSGGRMLPDHLSKSTKVEGGVVVEREVGVT